MLAKKLVDDLIYNEKGNDVLLIKYVNPNNPQVVLASNSQLTRMPFGERDPDTAAAVGLTVSKIDAHALPHGCP